MAASVYIEPLAAAVHSEPFDVLFLNQLLADNGVSCTLQSASCVWPLGSVFNTPALDELAVVLQPLGGASRPSWAVASTGTPDVDRGHALTGSLGEAARAARCSGASAQVYGCEVAAAAWLQRPQLRLSPERAPPLDVSQRIADVQALDAIAELRRAHADSSGLPPVTADNVSANLRRGA